MRDIKEMIRKYVEQDMSECPKSSSDIRILYTPIGYVEAGRKIMSGKVSQTKKQTRK